MKIRIRENSADVVKTIDRAGLMAGRFKDVTIKTREDLADIFGQDEGSYDYASGVTGEAAMKISGHVLIADADFIQKVRSIKNRQSGENSEFAQRFGGNLPEKSAKKAETVKNIHHYGEKSINTVQHGTAPGDEQIQRFGSKIAKKRQGLAKTDELIQRRQKEYAIKRIRDGSTDAGAFWRINANNSRRLIVKETKGIKRLLKDLAESVKALLGSLSAGGTAALFIIIIMILFCAALTMTEDGSYFAGAGDTTIVEVARAEIGNTGGDKFWKWYGFDSHVDWCCCFVSWCADRCGYIKAGMMPKFAACGNGAQWFKDRHRWSGKGYSPHTGDVIFFDFQQDGVLDHSGLVESCDGKTITTIEGNSRNSCRRNSYPVGDSRIAGYGLLVKPFMEKAQRIALKAIELAYPDAPKEAKYKGGRPTAAYAAALDRAYPNRSHWQASCKEGASCDVFVGVCMVDSGVDPDFPRGYDEQLERLRKRTDLYKIIISTTSRDIQESELRDGDIIQYDRKDGGGHICIYAGGRLRHAGINKWYPRTTSASSRLKIKGKKHIWVYRVRE